MSDPNAPVRLTEVEYDPFASPELARAVPTTEAQREIWLAVQMDANASLAYNESVTLTLNGLLDLPTLQNALLALSDRHEALRGTFSEDGQSMFVAARGQLQARVLDFRGRSGQEQSEALARLRADAVETPFDLILGPLMRVELVRLSDTCHELLVTGHHIVCDGWSFGVLSKDLMALYDCFARQQDPAALPPADGFADYALAQLDAAHLATAEADLQYWLGRYKDVPPIVDLPSDRPRAAHRSFESRREDLLLDAELVKALRSVGAKHGASLFVTLFGTFAGLIGRLSRNDDLVVGISAAGQSSEGASMLVGHCVNLLPVRVGIDMERDIGSLLTDARGLILDAYDHQSCTFGSLLKRLRLPRDVSRPSLVPVVFNLDAAIKSSDLSMAGLRADLQSNPRHFENFELFLNASVTEEGIVLELQYNLALFDRATVQRWLGLYRRALQRIAQTPGLITADAFAPDEAELADIARFNATHQPYEMGLRLSDLILRGTRLDPDAVAVVFEGRSVSYRELEGLAWGVAALVRAQGAAPGTLVGVCLERSVEMVAALVGVVLSGAAYVPLDPTLPADRLRQMCEDAALPLVLTRRAEAARVGAAFTSDCNVLVLDDLEPAAPLPLLGQETDPAYVIFTSGSTGRPKGAMNAHIGIVNRLLWMQEAYDLSPADRVMQKTPFSFDVSVWEFFWTVSTGATLVVASPEAHRDGGYLVDLIQRERITVMHFVPSMLRLFLAEAGVGRCQGLRRVVCSGEALPFDLVERFFEHLPAVKLANLYGPTEAAVDVTEWECRPGDLSGAVPIGRPIANTTMYVLDEKMRTLPLGVPGDLYIGGVQVGMGYASRPELTAERFLADPFRPSGRMYKTGDVAAWRADGALIYLGRSDFQVKLRGYRIELGEIEAQLTRHPSVESSVVVTWADGAGDVRLVAYVVPAEGAIDSTVLRDFLRQLLPDYMVPQHFVALPAIPLLTSGKVDRRALPAPVFQAVSRSTERVPPASSLEAQVLDAIEQVLKLPGLGVTDDFFELGGHSLLAAKLTARLNKELGVNLPLRNVFESPTARALAQSFEAALGSNAPRRQSIVHQPNQHEAPLTVMQERIRFMEEMKPGRVVYNTPSAHRLTGPFDRDAFTRAFANLVQRQPSLRTSIEAASSGRGHVQRVHDHVDASMAYEDLSHLPETEREAELMRRMQVIIDTPMNIAAAPLFRVALYRMAPEQHVFLFMPHHIVWDGWSFDLLYQEMALLYPAALAGRDVDLAAPKVTYVDYAHWHNQWLDGEESQAQSRFWKTRYAAIETPGTLPTDFERSPGMTGTGAVEWVHIDKALTERLRDVAREEGATLNMLVMAVYSALMSRALGGNSLVIGVPVRGRLISEVESVMGFFNNLLPVHLVVDPSRGVGDWLRDVKRELLDAFANQDVPFELLAAEPEIARHANKAGLYQSLFSFQDARDRERAWGALRHQSVLVMQKGATEDFGLWLMEVPGGLEGGINYNADLFEASTARVFRQRLVGLLRRVADAPKRTIETLLAEGGDDASAFSDWVLARRAAVDAMAAAAADRPALDKAPNSPLAPEAARLGQIWASLLGIDLAHIAALDNFFDLGGNSLLVMQAVTRAESELGLKIDPRRYVYESLQQLCAPSSVTEGEVRSTTAAAGEAAPAGGGILSKVLGRFGRR